MAAESQFEMMSLVNVGGGAAVELFDDELKRVIKNILDANTGLGDRSITLKAAFKVDKGREKVRVLLSCSSKLVASDGFETSVFVGVDPKQGVCAVEPDLAQLKLFKQDPAPDTKVTDLATFKAGQNQG